MDYVIQIAFDLGGYACKPADVTRKMQVNPDNAMARGEKNPKLDLPRENVWSIRSHAQNRAASVLEHWSSLSYLSDKRDIINDLKHPGSATLTIIVHADDVIPEIVLPPSMAAFAASIDASIDIDIYQ